MSDTYEGLFARIAPVLSEAGVATERIPFEKARGQVICTRVNGKRCKTALITRSFKQQSHHHEHVRCTVPNLEDECALIPVISIDGCEPYFYVFPRAQIRDLLREQTRDPSQLHQRQSKALAIPHPARDQSRYLPYLGAAHLL